MTVITTFPFLCPAQALDALLTRRRRPIEMLTAERNLLGVARGPIRRDIARHIRWLEKSVTDVDRELGPLDRKQIAAPRRRRAPRPGERDPAGQADGLGGRASVRAVRCMGALVAAKFNPVLRPFYQRLRTAGKPAGFPKSEPPG